jgi:hypothetical protein
LAGTAAQRQIAEQGRRTARRLHLFVELALFIVSIVIPVGITAGGESYSGRW